MTGILTIEEASATLKCGGVIAYPTEAVWGLGCDPFDQIAVLRLLALKQRRIDKGLILVAAAVAQLDGLVDWGALPRTRRNAVLAHWPGPHTWVMPATPRVPRWITGSHRGVGVRVSAHPPVVALCNAFGGVLVSTSANQAGALAPKTLADFDPALRAALDGIVGGEIGDLPRPTPIRDALNGEVLRD